MEMPHKIVYSHKEKIVNLLRRLIQTPSITGNEGRIIALLEKEMIEFGFDEVFVDDMGNLIGKIGSGSKVLAIDAHVDTVEIGNLDDWKYSPFSGEIVEDKIFGRGSADQKGGLASSLYAVKLLKTIGIPKNISIYFVASIHEESCEGMNWKFIIENLGIKPNFVILTEPSNLSIILGHRGRADIKIDTSGISSHGAEPDLGVNAIYKMLPIISEIESLHQHLPMDEVFGKETMTITEIKSESASLNAVPYSCSIFVDRRLGSNNSIDTILDEIKSLSSVKEAKAKVYLPDYEIKTYNGFSYKIKGYFPSWKMEEDHSYVNKAKKVFEEQFNTKPKISYWRFSTNGVTTKGVYEIPTIGFGPGNEVQAHTYNEYLSIEQLLKATEFYLAFLIDWGKD
ncbi:MAG: YgeY family selenium metabolism-linked hydrolase [Candidatus Thorarchaeota archaeon]